MRYCSRCLLSDTKPYLTFDENGVCSACHAHYSESSLEGGIDWNAREAEFGRLIERARQRHAPHFDALVPVSGGKDSITQVVRLREQGLRVLAVSVDGGIKTENGKYNLSLVADLSASLFVYRPEQSLHKRLIRIGFEDYGDPELMTHPLMMAVPLHVAKQFQVPLVLYGECLDHADETETGGGRRVSAKWFARFGTYQGCSIRVMAQKYDLPEKALTMYAYPNDLDEAGIEAVFMSYYFRWDAGLHLAIASRHGFQKLPQPLEGTFRDYVNTDDKINRIHHYMKVLKFGYGRATEHASEDIRHGRISREEAIELVRQHDLMPLSDYYSVDFCQYVGYERAVFERKLEAYRNPKIWERDGEGEYRIKGWIGG